MSLQQVLVEVLLLCATEAGIRRIRPPETPGAEPVRGAPGASRAPRPNGQLRVPSGDEHPHARVVGLVEALGLRPRFVHSTSWRFDEGSVVLTYVAVVDPPTSPTVELEPLDAAPVAVGEATSPPERIDPGQVLGHTLRHLAWLVDQDPVAARALEGWRPFLVGHRPEPFRALEDHLGPAAGRTPPARADVS